MLEREKTEMHTHAFRRAMRAYKTEMRVRGRLARSRKGIKAVNCHCSLEVKVGGPKLSRDSSYIRVCVFAATVIVTASFIHTVGIVG